jgi:CHAT domain-containing protein
MNTPDRAQARLEFAIQRAEKANDLYAWLIAVNASYERAKTKQLPISALQDLRLNLWSRADSFRAQFRSRAGRLWVGMVIERVMGTLFRDEVEAGNVAPARMFEMMESVKARTLLDQMHLKYVELPPELKKQARDIERTMAVVSDNADASAVASEIALSSQLSLNPDLGQSFEQAVRATEKIYAEANAGFSGVQAVQPLAHIQEALRPRDALIEYAIPYYPTHPAIEIHIFAITHDRIVQSTVDLRPKRIGFTGILRVDSRSPMDSSWLGQQIVGARIAIQEGRDQDADGNLDELYRVLILPLIEKGLDPRQFDRWIIVPHRVLHSIPWGALSSRENGRRLIQDVALCFTPSASIWHRLATSDARSPASFLALANPQPLSEPNLPSLPETEKEVDQIKLELPSLDAIVLKNSDATESAFRQLASGKGLIHVATHGGFPAQDALDFHHFLLAAGAGEDGAVHAEEIRCMNLQSAFLVTLSICNGGIYRFGSGDEPYGMLPALLVAGAQNVAGTLWSIEDLAGRVFMVEFYKNLLKCGPAEALRRAACKTIQAGWSLSRWAAFLTAGASDPPKWGTALDADEEI